MELEYKLIKLHSTDIARQFNAEIPKFSKEGWKVVSVSVVNSADYITAYVVIGRVVKREELPEIKKEALAEVKKENLPAVGKTSYDVKSKKMPWDV